MSGINGSQVSQSVVQSANHRTGIEKEQERENKMNDQMSIYTPEHSRMMTVLQVSEALGVAETTVLKYIKKLYPEKLRSGVKCWLTEVEVTAVKLKLQQNQQLARSQELPKTDLEKKMLVRQAIDILNEEIEVLQNQLEQARPAIEFHKQVGDSTGLHSVAEAAKMLGTGRNRLFEWLRGSNILRYNNEPYQRYLNSGYFVVKESLNNCYVKTQTFITPKGLQWIQKEFQ